MHTYHVNISCKHIMQTYHVHDLCCVEISLKDPVLPIEHCTLRSLGGHFCDVENSEAFVCGQNRTL